ncbi:TonB-dependent receptor [Sphingobium sp. PNB]|nr:TonB-dependent receptor [Sphingobium sp. PNB]MCB4859510.1 TonB-dependent receptor [Sphingobium sp. PNB]
MHMSHHSILRAALLAGASLSVAAAASAQTAAETAAPAEPQGEAIVVTGIRASLASAAKLKRDSVLIVDSISAEDVGKLPDVSIADSLARLPGVTAQRLEGRDQRLSIRGLGPDFSTTLLNGREQMTVGDNRGVEYDQYPSEFFQNVNVYKSADAALIAAGISGTVDLRMLRPLDKKDRVMAVSLRGQMNGMDKLNPDGKRYGYRASATYIDQFADDTLGLSLGFSASQTPSQNERFNSWGYPSAPDGTLIIGGAKPYVQSNLLKRYGAVGTLEWQPSDDFHSTFDVLASHFEEEQRLRGIEFPLVWGTDVGVSDVTVENGFVTAATFSNVYGVQRNDYNKRKADMISLGWNNDIRLNDALKLNVDASWSRAKRTDFLLETYSGTGYLRSGVPDTVRVERQSNGLFHIAPTLDYTDTGIISLTDPNGWGYNGTTAVVQAGFLNRPKFIDDMKSFRANLVGDISGSLFSQWEVGGNYSRRKKTSAYTSYFLCPPGGTDCTIAGGTPGSVAVPSEALLGSNVSLDYLGVPAMLTLNPLYLYDNVLDAVYDNRPGSLVRDNVVKEDVFTGYAKLSMDGELGGKPLKGAIGVQVIHSRQASTGTISNFANGVVTVLPVSGKDSYTNVLPSAQISVELEPSFFVKLGAAQTMVRPRLDQERINQEFKYNLSYVGIGSSDPQFSPFKSEGGNIFLRPYQSTNIDLSLEKYFRGGGYVSVSGFFKNLTDFVDPNNNIAYDFSAVLPTLPADQRDAILADGSYIGLVKSPANTGKGTIMGVEATASLPFKLFSPALDGFGIFASGSYTHSEVEYGSNPTESVTLPGLSKWVASGTAYFEKAGFQARVSYRYRSSFLGEVAGLSAAPTFRTAKAEGILDAQIGYEFQSGPLQGLSILLQGKNLTDQPFVTYQNDDPRQVIDYQRYGRDYYLGLTYKF